MSFKVAFIGAGSLGFTRELVSDLMAVPEFKDLEIAFTDINQHNLDMVYKIVKRDLEHNGFDKVKLTATTDRREAFKDCKYIFNVVRVGGLDAFALDVEVPLRYGVDQCVGDTLCAGGIMYAQRGIAVMLDFCKDIREVARPDVLLLNYANPNAMMTWACNVFGQVRTLGLCHGVQGGHGQIANVLGAEQEDVDIICAGINHQTWYTSVKLHGKDVDMADLLKGFEQHEKYQVTEKVRIDMFKRFGYYSTESNGHLSEYVPWYRKRLDEIEKWIDTSTWIHGETGGYLRICTENRNWFEHDFPELLEKEPSKYTVEERSHEHGSYIVEGLETGRVYRGHFNVVNNGTITNLPDDAIVEVPGYIDYNGINIPKVGDLPLGCAAVCNASISVQRLAVMAAVNADINLLRQAFMMDPLVGAVCNPPEIWQMVDEMLVAQAKWLPQYAAEVEKAKARLEAAKKDGTFIPVREGFKGAVRLEVNLPEAGK